MKRCSAPKGWALVPLEPTTEMLSGWIGRWMNDGNADALFKDRMRVQYRQMLDQRPSMVAIADEASGPEAFADPDEGSDLEKLASLIRDLSGHPEATLDMALVMVKAWHKAWWATDSSVLQHDLAQLLSLVGIGDHARDQSPHEVFQEALDVLRNRKVYGWVYTWTDDGLDGGAVTRKFALSEPDASNPYISDVVPVFAAPQPARVGWRPIDTAPKDGTQFLALTMEAQNPTARLSWWDGDGFVKTGKPEKFVDPMPHRWWPTHWQPMPAFYPRPSLSTPATNSGEYELPQGWRLVSVYPLKDRWEYCVERSDFYRFGGQANGREAALKDAVESAKRADIRQPIGEQAKAIEMRKERAKKCPHDICQREGWCCNWHALHACPVKSPRPAEG